MGEVKSIGIRWIPRSVRSGAVEVAGSVRTGRLRSRHGRRRIWDEEGLKSEEEINECKLKEDLKNKEPYWIRMSIWRFSIDTFDGVQINEYADGGCDAFGCVTRPDKAGTNLKKKKIDINKNPRLKTVS